MKKKGLVFKIILFIAAAAYIAIISLGKYIFPADHIMFNIYDETLANVLSVKLLKCAYVICIGYCVIQIANLVVSLSDKVKNSSAKTFSLLIGNALKYIAYIVVILACLGAWGIDTTTLVTGAGILTLVVGLGCQSLVSDIVAGIFMILEGDIKVGDVVVINGWRGTVLQIGLRRTKIEDAVGNINVINNSSISNIINNTRDFSYAIVNVGIEYSESIERVESILSKHMHEFKEHIPAITAGPYYKGVDSFGPSSVLIKLIAQCNEGDKFQVERDMNREIKLLFDKYNINIPMNQILVGERDKDKQKNVSINDAKLAKEFVDKQKELSSGIEEQER